LPPLADLLNRWPIAAKLNPLPLTEKLPYLLGAVIVARTAVGLTRIAADNPAWNPTPESQQDKVSTFLERVFMEGLGTMGTFLVLHAGQDVAANVIELVRPALRPSALLDSLKANHLSPQALTQVTETLARTFKTEVNTLETSPVLARVIYDKANLHTFQTLLNDKALWHTIQAPVEQHFARLNQHALPALASGLVLSTVFGGVGWQWLNDNVVRKSVVPQLSRWLVGGANTLTNPMGDEPKRDSSPRVRPLLLAANQPLISNQLTGLSVTSASQLTLANLPTLPPPAPAHIVRSTPVYSRPPMPSLALSPVGGQ
jgi:hypothetical protein